MELLKISPGYFIDAHGITPINVAVDEETMQITLSRGERIKTYNVRVVDDVIELYDNISAPTGQIQIYIGNIKKYSNRILIYSEFNNNECTYQALIL